MLHNFKRQVSAEFNRPPVDNNITMLVINKNAKLGIKTPGKNTGFNLIPFWASHHKQTMCLINLFIILNQSTDGSICQTSIRQVQAPPPHFLSGYHREGEKHYFMPSMDGSVAKVTFVHILTSDI